MGRPWRKASLACCCDPKGKEARRFFDRQVSTKGVEKTQIEAVSFKLEFMVGVVMYFCSAARNSPACKGKSLQCLRKCRFSYIDTSPALSARRHLTAALRYSARPPHRTSCLHLARQTHQTWCAPGHLGAPSPVQRTQFRTFYRELRFQS